MVQGCWQESPETVEERRLSENWNKNQGDISMRYEQIVHGTFISRPNRFLARVKIDGVLHTVHVKNTGRCKELLQPDAEVVLEYHPDAAKIGRKTQYSLVGVYKELAGSTEEQQIRMLVNMDSQAPNQVAREWLEQGGFERETGMKVSGVRREVTYGQSRFDLAFQADGKPAFMEVKGVTLEVDGTARFPDAPTERGVKHLRELQEAAAHGFGAYVLFVIQMKGIWRFEPNWETHEAFAQTLKTVSDNGVTVLAYDCLVWENHFQIDERVPVVFEHH